MSETLILKRTGSLVKPFGLYFRNHDLGGTDYDYITGFDYDVAYRIEQAAKYGIYWLYGAPTSEELAKLRLAQEKAEAEKKLAEINEKIAKLETS